jgi:hypothetical protein
VDLVPPIFQTTRWDGGNVLGIATDVGGIYIGNMPGSVHRSDIKALENKHFVD